MNMEGENNVNMGGVNQPMGNMGGEKKSGSLMWSIIAIVIVVLLGYLLVKNGDKTETTTEDQTSQSDSFGAQSDSSDINSIEADMETTNFDSLDVELE